MRLAEGMQTGGGYIQHETMTMSFVVNPFAHRIDRILTERTEVLGVVIYRVDTQGECHDRVATCYYRMDRIHTGVGAYTTCLHITALTPVPVRVEER